MLRDPDDIDIDDPDSRLASEPLVREGGVFVEPARLDADGRHGGGPLSADDDPDDVGGRHRPGTPDDVGYSWGTDASGAEDLWAIQQSLIEEDAENAVRTPEGLSAEASARVHDLMGDEVADAMPEGSKSSSATGEPTTPDHGGFPERSG